jgi:hypothetical protein
LFVVQGTTLNLNDSILSNHTGAVGNTIDGDTNSRVNLNTDLSYNNTSLNNNTSVVVAQSNLITKPATQNLYVSPGSPNFDYHLNRSFTNNPAIDAATGSTTTVDLDNNPRDAKPDLGAYEAVNPRIEFLNPVTVAPGGKATLTVLRIGDPSATITVLVSITGGTAVAGTDFQAAGNNGVISLTFAPGDKSKTVVIQTLAATPSTTGKTINVALSLPAASASLARLGNLAQTTVTIGGGQQSSPVTGFAATGIQPVVSGKGIKSVVIQFNAPLNAKQAKNIHAYGLQKLTGRRAPKISKARYNSGANSVTLSFSGPIRPGSSVNLILVASRLTDANNRSLSGSTSFTISA